MAPKTTPTTARAENAVVAALRELMHDRNLSRPQQEMLLRLARVNRESPPPMRGTWVSAWHRTASALSRKGLVTVTHWSAIRGSAGGFYARLTFDGGAVAARLVEFYGHDMDRAVRKGDMEAGEARLLRRAKAALRAVAP